MSIRFNENDCRPIGRTARGVRGIRLRDADYVAGVCLVEKGKEEVAAKSGNGSSTKSTASKEPTLDDVFDKKTYYNPGKIRSRLLRQLEKYEKMLAESETKAGSAGRAIFGAGSADSRKNSYGKPMTVSQCVLTTALKIFRNLRMLVKCQVSFLS